MGKSSVGIRYERVALHPCAGVVTLRDSLCVIVKSREILMDNSRPGPPRSVDRLAEDKTQNHWLSRASACQLSRKQDTVNAASYGGSYEGGEWVWRWCWWFGGCLDCRWKRGGRRAGRECSTFLLLLLHLGYANTSSFQWAWPFRQNCSPPWISRLREVVRRRSSRLFTPALPHPAYLT